MAKKVVTCACVLLSATAERVAAGGSSDMHIARVYDDAAQLAPQRAVDLSNRNASASASSTQGGAQLARYGHAALYYPETSSIMFLGGQTSSDADEPSILSSSFLLNLSEPFVATTPLKAVSFDGIPPTAWAVGTMDSDGRGWLLGGLASDCDSAPPALLLPSSSLPSFSTPAFHPRPPPRRRQAASISLGADLWLFGGIADRFTCSPNTAAYRGIDKVDTVSGSVESWGWDSPKGAGSGWEPPVGDARAGLFGVGDEQYDDEGEPRVVLVGGQTASGKLVSLRELLVFDPVDRSWTTEIATGEIPSPRMGHVLVPLGGDQFLLHGGLGANQQAFADLHLLTRAEHASWEWMTLPISSSSAPPPARAWHSATVTESGTVVVAFGMDTEAGEPSDDVWFLEVEEEDGSYAWSRDYSPPAAEEPSEAEGERIVWQPTTGKKGAAALGKRQIIANPKWTTSTEAQGQTVTVWEEPTTSTAVRWKTKTEHEAQQPSTTPEVSPPVAAWTPSSIIARPSSFSSRSSAALPSSSAASSSTSSDSENESSSKQTTIAATVGSLVALVAVLGLGGMAFRRHQARKGALAAGEAPQETPTPGFVTQMLYTRPVNKRMLSLGSTVSAPRSPMSDAGSEALDEMMEVPLGARTLRTQDPFSDAHTVSELGRLQARSPPPSPLPFTSSPTPSDGPAKGLIAALSPSIASVASIPYLAALTRTTSNESSSSYSQSQSHDHQITNDKFTIMTPTLGSRRSLRRLREDNTPLPSAVEFPAAPSALDGRRGSWLAFARRESKTSSQGHSTVEGLDEMRQVLRSSSPASSMAATVGASASRMNSRASGQSGRSSVGGGVSRPHTPLRVVNADVVEEEGEMEDPFRDH